MTNETTKDFTAKEFIYTTYIKSTAEKIWAAITNPEFAKQYWGNENVSDWKKDSAWKHMDGSNVRIIGKVLESNPPKRLVLSWAEPDNEADDSKVIFEIEQLGDMTRLNVIHNDFKTGSSMVDKVSKGWPLVLSNMKSFLETGKAFDILAFKSCGKAA